MPRSVYPLEVLLVADWGDIDDGDRREYDDPPRRAPRSGGGGAHSTHLEQRQRLNITIGVGAAVLLALGLGVGFAIGHSTAPKPAPAVVAVATPTVEPTPTVVPTLTPEVTATVPPTTLPPSPADKTAPRTPGQISPGSGDHINGTAVTLKWTKVTDPSGVTYSIEVQDYVSGKWSTTHKVTGITKTSYPSHTNSTRRRWRVWAVDGKGNASAKSDWATFYRTVTPKTTTTTKPKTTTTTKH